MSDDVWRRPVLTAGDCTYTWADVVACAEMSGEWTRFSAHVAAGLSCDERARAEGLDAAGPTEEAATRFRRELRLLAADDLVAWRATWSVDRAEWRACMRREALRALWQDELDDVVRAHPVSEEAVEASIWAEGVCSGRLPDLARLLATRLATLTDSPGADKAERIRSAVEGFPAWREAATAPDRLRAEIAARRLDWVWFDCATVVVEDEDLAREIAMRVRADGDELATVAAEAGTELEPSAFFLEEAPRELAPALMGSAAGSLIGPESNSAGHTLVLVRDRIEPTIEDERVRTRARRELLRRLLTTRMAERVRWHVDP